MAQHPVAPRDLLMTVARDLVMKGWQPVWCLQRQSGGFSPMEGLTGYDAPFPTVVPQPPGSHRLGFRPPPEVVIIDVDHYDAKRGADTIDRAEEWLGDLPPTYKVTSRGEADPSGRYLFRKPADLDFSDRALAQFADDHGKTSVEILRTGHRFSWAPGDINHKNGRTVQCFDPDGEPCLLPNVKDIPELPARWTEYLRNPPSAPSLGSYVRPGDGPQWWLMQPDESLSSDSELAMFAFDMMLSRVPMDEIFTHWLRVSRSDDPSWPWSREDFDRHVRSQAQAKAATAIAREDQELSVYEGLAGSPERLQGISREATQAFEQQQKLTALREQRIYETIAQNNPLPAQPLDVDEPQQPTQSWNDYLKELTRGFPEFTNEIKRNLIRKLAEADVAELLTAPFSGYRKIGSLPEPPEPETLRIVGKDSKYSSVIARAKVTVISGHRSSGKTWVTAAWAAQEMIAGNTVIWIDFERQDDQLTSKLRMLGVGAHIIDNQLRYTSALPPVQQLVRVVAEASEQGTHRVLVVVDAFRALQGRVMPGTNANDGDAVEQVYTEYLTPVAEAGANIVLLDHMSKTGDAGTFGSERKESAADYVIKVEKMCPFSKRTSGYSMLTLTKARGGHFDEGTPVGYLWVPADGDGAERGITAYPRYPELRNWAPEVAMSLEDTTDESEMGRKELAVLDLVRENRLALGTRELGRDLFNAYPDLFVSASAANSFARRMVAKGKLTKEEGKLGKYDLPDRPEPGSSPSPALDPAALEYEA
jgi:hypothetical protein